MLAPAAGVSCRRSACRSSMPANCARILTTRKSRKTYGWPSTSRASSAPSARWRTVWLRAAPSASSSKHSRIWCVIHRSTCRWRTNAIRPVSTITWSCSTRSGCCSVHSNSSYRISWRSGAARSSCIRLWVGVGRAPPLRCRRAENCEVRWRNNLMVTSTLWLLRLFFGSLWSGLAHTRGRLWRAAAAHLILDATTDVRVDSLPVVECPFEHRAAHAAEQAAGHLIDQRLALGVAAHLAYQNAGLGEVIIARAQRIGAAHHVAVGLPAILGLTGRIGPCAAVTIGRIHRGVAAVVVGHLAID